jgi:hypothetical protein
MSTWLYQIDQESWSPERYRLEIWEGQDWAWPVGKKNPGDKEPQNGDTVVFFYAPTGGHDPGFYGWAVVLEWFELRNIKELRFRPVAPSDHLKMHPWWNQHDASTLADKIRGPVKQGTLFLVPDALVKTLRSGISAWLGGGVQ